MRYELADEEWADIAEQAARCARVDDRRVLNGTSGSYTRVHRGAIYRTVLVHTPPPTTASFAGDGLPSGAGSWTHSPPPMTRRSK